MLKALKLSPNKRIVTRISKTVKQPPAQDQIIEVDNGPYFFGKNLMLNGVLMLMDEVDDDSVQPIIQGIMEYNLMHPDDRPEHITLFINSPGGVASSAYHLIDIMKTSPLPVYTIGIGEVASAGVMILMAGEKGNRMVTETTSIMSHQYSRGIGGKEHEIVAAAKEVSLDSARMMLHYRKCTKKTEAYIRKHLLQQSDCYLTPEEAVNHGICDEVIKTYQ